MKSLNREMFNSDPIGAQVKRLYDRAEGDYEILQILLMDKFGWTVGQCYVATAHLYRPDDGN